MISEQIGSAVVAAQLGDAEHLEELGSLRRGAVHHGRRAHSTRLEVHLIPGASLEAADAEVAAAGGHRDSRADR
eukprot:2165840-Prymnesium_polylepis.2